ncbi:MAG: MFS transporter [Dehalococcoidia bacterium]
MQRSTAALVGTVPFFYGWWVVIASAAIVFLTTGTFFYGFSTLVDPLEIEFAWSRALIGGGFSVALVASGVSAPIAGHLVDRLGAPRLLVAGVLLMGSGFLLLSQIQAAWQLYLGMTIAATGMSVAGPVVCWVAIAHWFVKKRGLALALMSCGVGTSGIMVVVLATLIDAFGWRNALVTIGISQIAICIPLALTIRHRPEEVGLLPDNERDPSSQPLASPAMASLQATSAVAEKAADEGLTIRQALATRPFWLLTVALTLASFGSTAIIGHLVAFLEDAANFSRGAASVVAMGIPFGSLLARISFGWLADHVAKRRLLAAAYVFQGLGILIFASIASPWQAVLFLLVFTTGWGGAIPVLPALEAEYFGLRAFGGIQGLMWALTTLGAFTGPIFAGAAYDLIGSYRPAFFLMSLTTMSAVPLILMLGRPLAWAGQPAQASAA